MTDDHNQNPYAAPHAAPAANKERIMFRGFGVYFCGAVSGTAIVLAFNCLVQGEYKFAGMHAATVAISAFMAVVAGCFAEP